MRKNCLLHLLLALCLLRGPLEAKEPDPAKRIERIAFGSCARQDRPQPIWQAILNSKPDLFIFAGDNVYADTDSYVFMKEQYRKLSRIPGYKQLFQTIPVLAIWDDHDYGINDGGKDFLFKEKSKELFLDFFQVPRDSPRYKREGLYISFLLGPVGQTVQIIVLDTRTFRDPLVSSGKYNQYGPVLDPKQSILGKDQWHWLDEELRKPAQIRLIISSIQVIAEEQRFEKWNNFPYERKRLFRLLKNSKAKGVFFLSGDRHFSEISVIDAGLSYPLYDFTSSSLNDTLTNSDYPENNKFRLATIMKTNNFGFIKIGWKQKEPQVEFEIIDEKGRVHFQHRLPSTIFR